MALPSLLSRLLSPRQLPAVAAQLAAGKSATDALNYANVAASICVQRMGAAPSMPSAAEVAEVLFTSRPDARRGS